MSEFHSDFHFNAAVEPSIRDKTRCYSTEEFARLSTGARGYVSFLEHNGAIDTVQREQIIELLLSLPHAEVDQLHARAAVLSFLVRENSAVDLLILDDLLLGRDRSRMQ